MDPSTDRANSTPCTACRAPIAYDLARRADVHLADGVLQTGVPEVDARHRLGASVTAEEQMFDGPAACASCGSSDLEPFTLGAAVGWWCHECGDMWEAIARRPHPFDPMDVNTPDGPVAADWCGRIGCAKPGGDPIHVCGCGFGLPGYLGHDPACPDRTEADVAAARAAATGHRPDCVCWACIGKAARP